MANSRLDDGAITIYGQWRVRELEGKAGADGEPFCTWPPEIEMAGNLASAIRGVHLSRVRTLNAPAMPPFRFWHECLH